MLTSCATAESADKIIGFIFANKEPFLATEAIPTAVLWEWKGNIDAGTHKYHRSIFLDKKWRFGCKNENTLPVLLIIKNFYLFLKKQKQCVRVQRKNDLTNNIKEVLLETILSNLILLQRASDLTIFEIKQLSLSKLLAGKP